MDDARHVLAAGRAHAVHKAELGALGRHPFGSLGAVDDMRHAVFQRCRGVLGEEVGRQPDQVDMAIGGDDVVFHGRSSKARSSLAQVRGRKMVSAMPPRIVTEAITRRLDSGSASRTTPPRAAIAGTLSWIT